MTIKRLMIANRGEIAVRIIRTARRMGLHTIAVYSTVDKSAPHVRAADEAVLLGDAPPKESYLNIDRIIDAARSTGADAIHTGYGFLAENPDFARRCADNGLIFVGPPAECIEKMGLKGVARETMQAAGVAVLPGIDHVDANDITKAAAEIGYPVLVKPSAGGGGKGMKIVDHAGQLDNALETARREAMSSFGNDSLIVEKYLQAPRHIEIQVFADTQGNCIHLNERDCSLQRRHQKIIEESPAPVFNPALRDAMGKAAVAAAQAIGYVGAGTVEFLLAADDSFYFMEMNTRLQVEHPVTEAVTGLDLVEWQLRIAAGEALPVAQQQVTIAGHAIEARLYAEEPLNDFLPASGRIHYLALPDAPSLRIDNGVAAGDLIGVFYDPMLMKLIAHGSDRSTAIEVLRRGLADLHVGGVTTNRDFLLAVLDCEAFEAGQITTDWLDHHLETTFGPADDRRFHLSLCGAILNLFMPAQKAVGPWDTAHNFRANQNNKSRLLLMTNGEEHWTTITAEGGTIIVDAAGEVSRCQIQSREPFEFTANGETCRYSVIRNGTSITVFTPRRTFEMQLPDDISLAHSEEEGNVQAPMSGKVVSVMVGEGDNVEKGAPLLTIEAMKMEHTVYAPADGQVAAVFFVEEDLVNEGTELLEFVRTQE